MLKHHKLISFVFGLLFLIVLQKFATPEPIFRFLLPAFLLYVGVLTFYNRWYLKKIEKYNFWIVLRPMLLLCSAFGVFLIVPSGFLRSLFLILAVAIITFFEIILGNFAENILLNETLVIAFGLFFYFFSSYYYAPAYQALYFLGVFCSASLLTRSFYEIMAQSQKTKIVGAITMGLFCSELYWVLNFLHFHYSVLSLLLFNFFYFCLILNYYYLFHILNTKKIQFHLFLMLLCTALAFAVTPWTLAR